MLPGIKDPDFLLYGGLSCRVALRRRPKLSLAGDGIHVATEDVLSEQANVKIDCVVLNASGSSRRVSVRWVVRAPDGSEVAAMDTGAGDVPALGVLQMPRVEMSVKSPMLWSVDSPLLHVAVAELIEDGKVIDSTTVRFGLRSACFESGKGFFLNGERLELRGCNRHESMPGFGRALPVEQHREDARLLKDCGCNFVRLSHYPQHPAFLDACDELGLLVYPEVASWKSVRTGSWLKSALRQMERLIRRDRNRPSAILWGLGNESRSRKAYFELGSLVSKLDPSRPTIYAENHLYRAKREGTLGMVDVYGCNYELDVVEEAAATAKTGTSLVSECSNVPTAVRGDPIEELRQVDTIEEDLCTIEGKRSNAGYVLWCMNDYATLRKKRYVRYCGIVDGWRMPKAAYAFLRARQLEEPVIALYAEWGEKGDMDVERDVHVFTNCETVTVACNGTEVVSVAGAPHMNLRIPFEQGELAVVGRRNGAEVRDSVRSYSAASRIVVEPADGSARAGDRETVDIRLRIVDEAGVSCRDWAGVVRARVDGCARSRAYKADGSVPVWAGEGRLFITGTGEVGKVSVVVSGEGLTAGRAVVAFE